MRKAFISLMLGFVIWLGKVVTAKRKALNSLMNNLLFSVRTFFSTTFSHSLLTGSCVCYTTSIKTRQDNQVKTGMPILL